MKRKTSQYLWTLLKRSAAVLLLVLFTGIPVFELVHKHEHDSISQDHCRPQLTKSTAKCKICDHFARTQHSPFLASSLFSILYFEGENRIVNSAAAEKLVVFCSLSRSNKGPPSRISI